MALNSGCGDHECAVRARRGPKENEPGGFVSSKALRVVAEEEFDGGLDVKFGSPVCPSVPGAVWRVSAIAEKSICSSVVFDIHRDEPSLRPGAHYRVEIAIDLGAANAAS